MDSISASLDQFIQDHSSFSTNSDQPPQLHLCVSPSLQFYFVDVNNIFYKLILRVQGYSFDLTNCTEVFRAKIKPVLSLTPSETNIKLIETATKAMIICYKLLENSIEKKERQRKFVYSNTRNEQIESTSTLQQLFTLISEKEKNLQREISTIKVALEYDCPKLAYSLITKQKLDLLDFSCIDKQLLQKLVYYCIINKNDDLLRSLIPFGISIKNPDVVRRVIFKAIKAQQKEVVSTLIKSDMQFDIVDENKTPLLSKLIDLGWQDMTLAVIEKSQSVYKQKDIHGNTPLHQSFGSTQLEITEKLFLHIDPQSLNNENETPFQFFLKLVEKGIIQPEKAVNFLKKTFSSTQHHEYTSVMLSNLSKDTLHQLQKDNRLKKTFEPIIKSDLLSGVDLPILECLFLSGCDNFPSILNTIMPEEVFTRDIAVFAYKYPLAKIDNFKCTNFVYASKHYEYPIGSYAPQNIPKNVTINDLNLLFNRVENYYVQLDKFYIVKDSIARFTDCVINQKPFLGTPKIGSAALKDFYNQIQIHLLHIIQTLKNTTDDTKIISFINQIHAAELKCGGRYYSIVIDQYFNICCNSTGSFEEKLMRSIDEFRSLCFDMAITQSCRNDKDTVHNRNQALRVIGKKYNIPGYEQALQFEDIFAGAEYNLDAIERAFLTLYVPHRLICEWLMPMIKTDPDMRDLYIDWHKANIPADWKKSTYIELETQLSELLINSTEKASDDSLLTRNSDTTESHHFSEAIENQKITDYLTEFVYNEDFTFSIDALNYMLKKLEVIQLKSA